MEQTIIKVQFLVPVDGRTEYYFSSLAAIFERFSVEQIGCALSTLWNCNIDIHRPKTTRRCVISREPIYNKPQTNKKNH